MNYIIHHEVGIPKMDVPVYRDLLHPQLVEEVIKSGCDEYKIWMYGENIYSYNKFNQGYTRFSIDY
jgi:hypothetical protein